MFLLSKYHVPTTPVPRSYYPSTTFYYPSTTFLLSQYHFYTIPVPLLYYPNKTNLTSFVSNSIVGLESLPFYQPFTIPVPIQIDNTQRLSFLRPDSLLH